MTRVVSPASQCTGLTEAEVMAALADPNSGNPIAVEVARRIAAGLHPRQLFAGEAADRH
jgi:hypothetical protein